MQNSTSRRGHRSRRVARPRDSHRRPRSRLDPVSTHPCTIHPRPPRPTPSAQLPSRRPPAPRAPPSRRRRRRPLPDSRSRPHDARRNVQTLAAAPRALRAAPATNTGMNDTDATSAPMAGRPTPQRTHAKQQAKDRGVHSPLKPSGIKKSKNASPDRARSRGADLSARLDRFEMSARNLVASMAEVQVLLADLSAEVVHEAARLAAGRDAAAGGRGDGAEGEGGDLGGASSS
ncbi:hypothetical protein EYC84_001212 [Monilinia fructicola]|uniref:Uncharacterized protein n=1 Tax=Monilinia fructicola TaxID=38448 RepID=A0A5M9JP75_MONFR|nr:hypothetical protein EYC84_001212 [Monilinia fructicola]